MWFERRRAGDVHDDRQAILEDISASTPVAEAQPMLRTGESRSRSLSRSAQQTVQRVEALVGTESRPGPNPVPRETLSPVDPFVLACVRGKGVVLLTRAPLLKNQQRMARDIVLAAMHVNRQPAIDLQVVEYRYPPAADLGQGRVGSPDRALRAFLSVQRQSAAVDDSGSGGMSSGSGGMNGVLILITDNAHSLFREWLTDPHVVIGDFHKLAGDAAQKRALWLRLSAAI